jgi:outer membrane protein
MKKKNSIILYTLLVGIIVFLVYRSFEKDKVVYVDNVELFAGFKMKLELEKKYKEVESVRKSILDSIYNEIKIKVELNNVSDNEQLNLLKKEFLMKKELFEKENSETMTEYNRQIWNQLNEYTKQYGEESGYDYILGANGQGVLMYAKPTKNVTKELLDYSNKKYNGK